MAFEAKNKDIYAGIVQCSDIIVQLIQAAVSGICKTGKKIMHFTLNALINALPQFVAVNSQQFLIKYLDPILACLWALTVRCGQSDAEEEVILSGEEYNESDFVNGEFETNHSKIQYSLLTAWGCVISCIIDANGQYNDKLMGLVPGVINFIQSCYNNGKCTRRVLLSSVTLVGDVVYFNPNMAKQVLGSQTWFTTMVSASKSAFTDPKDTQSLSSSLHVFSQVHLI
eukprot:gnl/Chilomastix_caulleri/2061.p1 GENE.gnl/Chilomastix_caulleri/2061~~gnl/Chilomastix_caulleri/2061.p1  ORF type:complete len:227 (+),score=72.51 gnl/Chilomastix_caulleri/2061:496-1176(+)